MRIVHVLHSHGYGGAESHTLLMMQGQRAAGHEVHFAGPLDSWIGRACAAEGIAATHIAMHGLYDVLSHWRLRRLVRQWQADIVHGHLIRGAMYAGRAGHRTHPPLAICTAHATTAKTHMQRCAHIIAVSGAVREHLIQAGYAPERVSVIHNGVPDGPWQGTPDERAAQRLALRRELGIPDGVFAVVNAGRFIHDKGQDLLMDALRRTAGDAASGVHLYLIGDPGTEFGSQLRQTLQVLRDIDVPLASRIHLLGYRQDVQRILPAFDLFALASRREAISLAVIEAFAARLPVVATAVGGVPEIVQHEQTGLLVPANDAAALGEAIGRLHAQPALARELAQRGREVFERQLTAERMVAQTLALYTAALQRCPAR